MLSYCFIYFRVPPLLPDLIASIETLALFRCTGRVVSRLPRHAISCTYLQLLTWAPKTSRAFFLFLFHSHEKTYNLVAIGAGTGGLVSAAGSAGVYAKAREGKITSTGLEILCLRAALVYEPCCAARAGSITANGCSSDSPEPL